jgi:hypothetical protein
MKNITMLACLVALAFPLGGCRVQEAYTKWASQASDSTDVVSAESAMLIATTEGADPTMSAEEAATAASESATRFFQPEGCLTAVVSGRTVVYTLNDCTGPYGLVHVTGDVTVEYTIQGDGLGFTATAEGLDVNGGSVDIANQGVYRRVGTRHEITGSVSGRGTGPRGNTFTRTGNRTVTWDPASACLTLDGAWMTDVEGKAWTTVVDGFAKCGEACPASGGFIEWSSDRGSLRLAYDGTAVAAWSTSNGREGTVELFCE